MSYENNNIFICTRFQYQCCGVYGYSDFTATKSWKSSLVTGGTTYNLKIPIVCCDELPSSTDLTCTGTTTGINANKVSIYSLCVMGDNLYSIPAI